MTTRAILGIARDVSQLRIIYQNYFEVMVTVTEIVSERERGEGPCSCVDYARKSGVKLYTGFMNAISGSLPVKTFPDFFP
jgi:hypothetical protein